MIFGNICSYFPQKVGFDISYKLSIKKTIYMKCQSLFSGKDNRNVNLPSAEFAKRMVKAYFQRPMVKISRRQLGGRSYFLRKYTLRFHVNYLLLENKHEILSGISEEKKIVKNVVC